MDFAEGRGVTGRDLLWKRERELIQNDLQALLEQRRRSAEPTTSWSKSKVSSPMASQASAPVSFALSDGRKVLLRGKIDRIDESVDRARLDVIDYKTGRVDPSQKDLDSRSGDARRTPSATGLRRRRTDSSAQSPR